MSQSVECGPSSPGIEFPWFPTRWQAVIWRNAAFFPAEKIASLLRCPVEEYRRAAEELGLGGIRPDPQWRKQGYLSIIKSNWDLLDCPQLLELLEWDAERLNRCLHEEDFLFAKLGRSKPACPPVFWEPLTAPQREATARFRKIVDRFDFRYREPPFFFMDPEHLPMPPVSKSGPDERFNFIHGYFSGCGDVFDDYPERDPLPEGLLARYAALGVRGVWLHAVLYRFHPVPGAEKFSGNWRRRLENLNAIARKCRQAGVPLYLYLNEPRGIGYDFFKARPDWTGADCPAKLTYCCCTSVPAVLEWTREAAEAVFAAAPDLAGAFLINMSENATHCDSRAGKAGCPRCASRDTADMIAECIRALEEGIHAANPRARVIAEDWAWQQWTPDGRHDRNCLPFKLRVLSRLPENVSVMCLSEWGQPVKLGSVDTSVADYSISHPGPSPDSAALWEAARARGLERAAKVQINNSWELSALPYIPVPYLIREHLDNIGKCGVEGLMLSWTLGGYPGGNLELLRHTPEELAERDFPGAAELALRVWKMFSDAFRMFPFSIVVVYFSPMTSGPAAPFFLEKTGRKATMVGFPWDDLTGWRSCYPEPLFEEQFEKMHRLWQQGVALWRENAPGTPQAHELAVISEAAGCHINSTWNHIRFVRRRDGGASGKELEEIVDDEIRCVERLLTLVRGDSRLGFEASNHYFYTPLSLVEKIVSCEELKRTLRRNKGGNFAKGT